MHTPTRQHNGKQKNYFLIKSQKSQKLQKLKFKIAKIAKI
jgi:hypothetical protein